MGAAENRHVVQEYIQAISAHDVDRVVSFYAEDGVRDAVGMAAIRGREDVEAFYQMTFSAVPDVELRNLAVMADDEGAFAQWEESGTNTGASRMYDGTTARGTGRSYSARFAAHYTIRDGQIIEERLFVNYLDVFRQLGLLPSQ